MAFLAPWFLLLAGAAAVPLLIHLMRRRIGLQVEFPAARYLARAEREHSRTLRMRNLLLMLLRIAAVLLLAVAAARPVSRIAGAGHAPTALAIVLDNSMSTSVVQGGAPLLDQLKAMAADVLRAANPDDRIWLATADGALRGGTPASLLDAVQRVRALPGAGDVRGALTRAAAAVEGSALEARHVVVLTDGQRTSWREPVQVRGGAAVSVFVPAASPPANRAVLAAEPRPVRWTPRGALATRALATDTTTYRIALGQRTLARGTVAPSEEALVRTAPAERGWTAGIVEIEPDELPADNVRHFAAWIGPAPSVRIDASAGPFVRNAVEVLRSTERVVEGAGILIASAEAATTLPALLLAPADPVRTGAANRTLERLGIPWRLGAARREAVVVRGDALAGAGAGASDVTVALRYQLAARGAAEAETLAAVAGGRDAWIVAGDRYVLVASPLLPDATGFPVSAAFLPWLADVLAARLHAEPGSVRHATPGARVPRPAGVTALESAAGGSINVAGPAIEAPATPGTYFFVSGTRRVGALVVNAEPAESRLERWSPDELGTRVSAGARVSTDREQWVRDAFVAGAARRSLVVPLLLALLLVLAAEIVVATSSRGLAPAT